MKGHIPTGDGTWVERGTYDGDCFGGGGDATFVIEVPTGAGTQRISGPFGYTYQALPRHGGVLGGEVHGDGFTGDFDLVGFEGDCVVNPLTGAEAFLRIHFAGDAR